MLRNILWLFVCSLILLSCRSSKSVSQSKPSLEQLATWMTGKFDSADQAAEDSNYYDITLNMSRIWPDRKDGYWLYVEQAVTAAVARPYRQRIYQLTTTPEGKYLSKVFELNNPARFVNKNNEPAAFSTLTPDSLTERSGCVVTLLAQNGTYAGATGEKTCESNLRGAAYATSKVTLFPDRMESWDQGFDAAGNQVWGATTGGYIFIKRENYGL
ncbi:MAG: chromophore lyase CpcT/CpeT [Bacteroidia bacterium]|nr:chromophore lyase CpcT/CpeT [Bacteroidia bacterium]